MINQTSDNLKSDNNEEDVFTDGKFAADSGFHSKVNIKMLADDEIDAYLVDPQMRSQDPRLDHSGRYIVRDQKERKRRNTRKKKFIPDGFFFDADLKFCTCPAGKKLYRSGYRLKVGNFEATKFKAPKSACSTCDLRSQCLRYPERTEIRQVAYFHGRSPKAPETFISRMKRKIDTAVGQMIYSKRIAIAEPPFAQITIEENTINIKFGINGTGKSTISKAIQLQCSNEKQLKGLTPFKYLEENPDNIIPSVDGIENIKSVAVFNESYIFHLI